jgi:hypothetical protein
MQFSALSPQVTPYSNSATSSLRQSVIPNFGDRNAWSPYNYSEGDNGEPTPSVGLVVTLDKPDDKGRTIGVLTAGYGDNGYYVFKKDPTNSRTRFGVEAMNGDTLREKTTPTGQDFDPYLDDNKKMSRFQNEFYFIG